MSQRQKGSYRASAQDRGKRMGHIAEQMVENFLTKLTIDAGAPF